MSWKQLAFWVALLAGVVEATPASAEPVSAAIAATAVFIAGAGASAATLALVTNIITSLLITAVSAGLTYVAQAIAGKPSVPSIGIRGTLEGGEDQPRTFAVGKFATAGTLVYANTWTADSDHPNAFLVTVIQLADIPITSLDKIFVGDIAGTYSTGGNITLGISGYSIAEFEESNEYYLWAKFYDGTQTTADADLVAKFGNDPDHPWLSSMVGRGIPYVILTARYNRAIFSGFPNYMLEGKGMKFYDQRLDTTEGGSGAHRYNTPSTWAYSDNPIVIINNILRGIKHPTSTGYAWMYGLQTLPSIRVPSTSWFAAMNECDSVIHDISGVDEPQYRCGAEIPISMQPIDAIAELQKACNARMAEIGGTYKILAGAASPSYVYSFTDDDIIITQGQDFDQFPSLDNMINAITAKHPEPAESWNVKDAPPLYDAALELEDGGRRLVSNVQFGVVPYKSQVQRLMVSAKNEARKFRKHSLVLPPAAWGLEPNDTVQWNSTKNGYVNKLFIVEQVIDSDNLDVGVAIVEINPADYDFDPDTDYQPVIVNPVTVPSSSGIIKDPPDVLRKVTENLRNVQRLLDHYAEIHISSSYKEEIVLPGLIEGVSASVSQEITLRADADSALAELITQAQAMADNATATALIKWQTAAGPEGVVSRLALVSRVDLDEEYTEAGLYIDAMIIGGDTVSQITLDADYIWLNAAADRVLLSDGGVTTAFLAESAATTHEPSQFAGPTTIPNDTDWHILVSSTLTSIGKPIICSGVVGIVNTDEGSADHDINIRLTRNGTLVWPSVSTQIRALGSIRMFVPIVWCETPGVGEHTYAIEWKKGDSLAIDAFNIVLDVEEIKR